MGAGREAVVREDTESCVGASSEQQGGLHGHGGVLWTPGGQVGMCHWVVMSASEGVTKHFLF